MVTGASNCAIYPDMGDAPAVGEAGAGEMAGTLRVVESNRDP